MTERTHLYSEPYTWRMCVLRVFSPLKLTRKFPNYILFLVKYELKMSTCLSIPQQRDWLIN